MAFNKKTWTEGTQTSPAKVTIGGTNYNVTPETRTGATPATASEMNRIEQGIKDNETNISNINSGLENISVNGTDVLNTADEYTLVDETITNAGLYFFSANIPVNYYGGTGRELSTCIKINNESICFSSGVINTNAYTVSRQMCFMAEVPANANLKLTIQSSTASDYRVNAFKFQYMRLK